MRTNVAPRSPVNQEQVSARCFYISKHLSTVRRSAELTAAPRNTL